MNLLSKESRLCDWMKRISVCFVGANEVMLELVIVKYKNMHQAKAP